MDDRSQAMALARLRAEHEALVARQAAAEARHAAELAALRRQIARPRRRAGRFAALCLVALVALVPVSILAANPFTDLTGGPHDENIGAIYAAGVTRGCVPDQEYCPTASVTREEMASFLARLGGLGNNAPVANARTVGGYAPSGLVRAVADSGYTGGTTVDLPASIGVYLSMAETRLTLPGPGYVLVTGTVSTVAPSSGTTTSYTQTRLRDVTADVASPVVRTTAGAGAGASYNIPATATWVFTAPAGGERTFAIETARVAGGVGRAFHGMITAVYIPFGPTGGTP